MTDNYQLAFIAKTIQMDRLPMDRTKRSGSLRKLALDKLNHPLTPLSPTRSDIPLKHVIDEVLKHLIDIIEMLLLEQNSNNYISFMKKMEEMYEQFQRKIVLQLDEKMEGFKLQVTEGIKLEMAEGTPTKVKNKEEKGIRNNERKHITQSILAYRRSNSFKEQRSQEPLKNFRTSANFTSFNRQAEELYQQNVDKTLVTSELLSLSSRLSQIEKNHGKSIKELMGKMEGRMELAFKDIAGLTQRQIQFRLKYEEKLQTNFEAIWNVIADLRAQVPNNR